MKKLLVLLTLTAATSAYAQQDPVANGIQMNQRDSTNTEYNVRWLEPTPGTACVMTMGASAPYAPSCVAVPAAPSQSSASRSLNSAFQISSTRAVRVTYSVRISTTATLSGGQTGEVVLEIASDSGFTSNVQTLALSESGQSVSLAIALTVNQVQTAIVAGYVPAGYYVRLRTVNTVGSPSFTYRAGQEVLQ